MTTLPTLAAQWGISLDALRTLVRRDPELRRLGSVVGASRGFSPAEAETIRAAFEARQAARGQTATTVATVL